MAGLCCAGERPASTQQRVGEFQSQCRIKPSVPPVNKYGLCPSALPIRKDLIEWELPSLIGGGVDVGERRLLIACWTVVCGWLGSGTEMRRGTSLSNILFLLLATEVALKHLTAALLF